MIDIQQREQSDGPSGLPDELHPVISRILHARHIEHAEDLDYALSRLLPFSELEDIDKAATLVADAISNDASILIVADYDADGATSCALAIKALRDLGASDVDYIVPDRFKYGYGLTPEIARLVLEAKPDLVITVDNGIASFEGIAVLRENNINVLVTDHHIAAESMPNANAIVNPNRHDCTFKSKHIAGVGVIFYVLLATRSRLRELEWFEQQNIKLPNFSEYLDLVALGTVADVVQLDYNNRILVRHGLKRIRAGQCCIGIQALVDISGRKPERLVGSDLGFSIAPKLNAAGRLEDMSHGIECLLATDKQHALSLANELNELNVTRKQIEKGMREEALSIVEQLHNDTDDSQARYGYCLYQPDWHEGVIGIIAGRLKDRLHRPVIVFARSEQGQLKGSARSIPGIHIRDILDAVATIHPQLISKFGGHAMAAGLSLDEHKLDDFTVAFDQAIEQVATEDMLHKTIHSDGALEAKDISLEFISMLDQYGPWGQGFPEPSFDGVFELVQRRIVGEHHLKMQLRYQDDNRVFDAIAFNHTDANWPAETNRVRAVYQLSVNEWQGNQSPQMIISHIEPV